MSAPPDRWVNGVYEVTVPLDVDVDAADETKLEAAIERLETIDVPNDAVVTIRAEVVADGEPIARS